MLCIWALPASADKHRKDRSCLLLWVKSNFIFMWIDFTFSMQNLLSPPPVPTIVLLKAAFFSLFLQWAKWLFFVNSVFQTNYLKVIYVAIFSWKCMYVPVRASDEHKIPSVTPKQTQYFSCAALSGGSRPMVSIRSLDPHFRTWWTPRKAEKHTSCPPSLSSMWKKKLKWRAQKVVGN